VRWESPQSVLHGQRRIGLARLAADRGPVAEDPLRFERAHAGLFAGRLLVGCEPVQRPDVSWSDGIDVRPRTPAFLDRRMKLRERSILQQHDKQVPRHDNTLGPLRLSALSARCPDRSPVDASSPA